MGSASTPCAPTGKNTQFHQELQHNWLRQKFQRTPGINGLVLRYSPACSEAHRKNFGALTTVPKFQRNGSPETSSTTDGFFPLGPCARTGKGTSWNQKCLLEHYKNVLCTWSLNCAWVHIRISYSTHGDLYVVCAVCWTGHHTLDYGYCVGCRVIQSCCGVHRLQVS